MMKLKILFSILLSTSVMNADASDGVDQDITRTPQLTMREKRELAKQKSSDPTINPSTPTRIGTVAPSSTPSSRSRLTPLSTLDRGLRPLSKLQNKADEGQTLDQAGHTPSPQLTMREKRELTKQQDVSSSQAPAVSGASRRNLSSIARENVVTGGAEKKIDAPEAAKVKLSLGEKGDLVSQKIEQARAHFNAGYANFLRREPEKGEEDYLKALQIPEFQGLERALTHNSLSFVYFVRGQYDKAIDERNKALAIKELQGRELAVTHYSLAVAYAENKDLRNAIIHYKRAIQMDELQGEALAEVLFSCGLTYREDKQYEKSIEQLKNALKIKEWQGRDVAKTHHQLGFAYYENNQFTEAVDEFQEALGIKEWKGLDRARTEGKLAEALVGLEQYEEALGYYKKFIEGFEKASVPDMKMIAFGHHGSGNAYLFLKQDNKALKEYKTALTIKELQGPERAMTHISCGKVLFYLGKYKDAIIECNLAMKITAQGDELYNDAFKLVQDCLEKIES